MNYDDDRDGEFQENLLYYKEWDSPALLKEYFILPQLKDKDDKDPDDPRTLAANQLLTERLDTIIEYLRDSDLSLRIHSAYFLGDVDSKTSLSALAGALLYERDMGARYRIKDILCRSDNLEEIKETLYNAIGRTEGETFELLAEIIGSLQDQYFINNVILRIKNSCSMGHKKCQEDIIPENSFFVGHQFSLENRDDLRRSINYAVQSVVSNCMPYYADDELKSGLFCKICKKIKSTRFGIFDISTNHGAHPSMQIRM